MSSFPLVAEQFMSAAVIAEVAIHLVFYLAYLIESLVALKGYAMIWCQTM